MTNFYTADIHLGHRLVAGHRGFGEDIEAHNAEIIERWDFAVNPEDIVYVLGDISVSSPTKALALLASLPGRKRLIAGNHDVVNPMHRDAPKWAARYGEVFEWVAPFARRKIAGRTVLLSHFPYGIKVSPITPGPEWRPTGYDGYLANEAGQIRGRFGRVLKPWLAGQYEYIAIPTGGTATKNVTVHSLVCTAFHGPRPEGLQVAHNDGNTVNNRATNLRWATRQENSKDRELHGTVWREGLAGEKNGRAKLTAAEASYIRESQEPVKDLMAAFGVGESTIRSVRSGQTWKPEPDRTRDHTPEPRYMQYRLPDLGEWLLHGHTHSTEVHTSDHEIHVGWDAWRRLVSENEIERMILEESDDA